MPAYFGPLLTNVQSAQQFVDFYKRGSFSTAKVVTGWGLDEGWSHRTRQQVAEAIPRLVVRTTAGDPSNSGASPYLIAEQVVDEISFWYAHRKNLIVELGNEPDVMEPHSEDLVWVYNYYLQDTIRLVREHFPEVKLISPAVRVNPQMGNAQAPKWDRWLEILAPAIKQCDYVGVHLYGWHNLSFDHTDTAQFLRVEQVLTRLVGTKTRAATEVGIHDVNQTPEQKLEKYRTFARMLPGYLYGFVHFYHLNQKRDIHPEYVIPV